jgi:hypothetical protein
MLSITLKYTVTDKYICVSSFFGLKKTEIYMDEIEGYNLGNNKVSGMRLSGFGIGYFSFGRVVIDRIGPTYTYITDSNNIIYLKTESITYAISPIDTEKIMRFLENNNISRLDLEFKPQNNVSIHKDKFFMVPLVLTTIINFAIIIVPLVFYYKELLPSNMPINFNAAFEAVEYSTQSTFVFYQMGCGLLNMVILLCMYFAAYFCAKYDRKAAYKYLYASLGISLIFLLVQIRILRVFV